MTSRYAYAMLALLSACAQNLPPESAVQQLNQRYQGNQIQDFFTSHGRPVGAARGAKTGKAYSWASLRPDDSVVPPLPSVHNSAVQFTPPAQSFDDLSCLMEITTDKKDTITGFIIRHDSIGTRSNSYCADIFSP